MAFGDSGRSKREHARFKETASGETAVRVATESDTPLDTNLVSVTPGHGLSTEAKQDTGNASLASIDGKLTAPISVSGPLTDAELRASAVPVDGSGVTQPVSAASLPLPSGASTAAKQDTGNASLSSIDSKLNTLGQKTGSGSVPVVLSSDTPGPVQIQGGTGGLIADVVQDDGRKALVVQAAVVPQSVGGFRVDFLKNGAATNMAVNGSVTPVVFQFTALAAKDIRLNGIRLRGSDNGIKLENFMALNSSITNGMLLEIKSQDEVFTYPAFKKTSDIRDYFNFGGGLWEVNIGSALDHVVATALLESPIVIKKQGTYATDDYVKMTVRDNLTSVTEIEMLTFGNTVG